MRGTRKHIAIPALVSAMIEGGASFFFTDCGSLFVANLGMLPGYLADEFFNCEGRELVRFLRAQAGQAGAMRNGQANAYSGAKNALVVA